MISHPNNIIEDDLKVISSALEDTLNSRRRILVTGATGFIAYYIVESLLSIQQLFDRDIIVYALARNKDKFQKRYSHHKDNKNLKFICQDINHDLKEIEHLELTDIIHAASYASPKYFGKDPIGTLLANTRGTLNLLEYAQGRKLQRFLFISSAEVYGKVEKSEIVETDYGYIDPMSLRACYGESKRMGENMCVAWFHQKSLPILVVRPFHTYGPGMELDDGRVYADFVKNIVELKNIALNSDGRAERAFCYLSDAVIGIITVLCKGKPGEAYNLGNPKATISIKELAYLVQGLFPERSTRVDFSQETPPGYLPSGIDCVRPNIEKLAELGWQANIGLEVGFRKTIESYINGNQ